MSGRLSRLRKLYWCLCDDASSPGSAAEAEDDPPRCNDAVPDGDGPGVNVDDPAPDDDEPPPPPPLRAFVIELKMSKKKKPIKNG